jgi:multidrug efflux system membrane fusion protein
VVELVQARIADAPVQLSALGQVSSSHSVSMRPQVSGTLSEVYFTEGQAVTAGQKLFLIDPAPYQAVVAQQRAQLARDRAALASAKAQAERLAPLAAKDFVTPQEYEDARAAAAQAEAVVESDQAALASAQINLDRTLVRAPIAGRTGSLSVKSGNIVGPSDAEPVLSINQLDPVNIDVSVPQAALPKIQSALAAGPVTVQVSDEQAATRLGEGRLVFVDNAIDTSTGTVRLRAECPNREQGLWPGSFVTVTVVLSVQHGAVLVPEKSVQQGAEGAYVFLVGDDHRVSLGNVTVDRQVGDEVVIASGLSGGETVVAKAPRNLEPGMQVTTAAAAAAGNDGGKPAGAHHAPHP